MNIKTGELIKEEALENLPMEEQSNYVKVFRDLTKKEGLDMYIKKYAPCGCGSGKKFKFCCHRP